MIADKWVVSRSAALLLLIECAATIFAAPMASAAPGNAQVTVLYNAFGKTSAMQKDWGYAALVEYSGKRILFGSQVRRCEPARLLAVRPSGFQFSSNSLICAPRRLSEPFDPRIKVR